MAEPAVAHVRGVPAVPHRRSGRALGVARGGDPVWGLGLPGRSGLRRLLVVRLRQGKTAQAGRRAGAGAGAACPRPVRTGVLRADPAGRRVCPLCRGSGVVSRVPPGPGGICLVLCRGTQPMKGALLVAGTSSDAGKSMIAAGLCRWLARQGVAVAPFKAQNMSLNSFVTAEGAEIGRAQAMQAAAAGIEPTADMNPVLLKPGSERHSQLVVLGQAEAEADALGYRAHAPRLLEVALDSLAGLRDAYDVVICEGACSSAGINLGDTDVANMGLARAAGLPVVVTGDIDRGGVFAAMYGTLALLAPEDQALISGFVINKFRGAPELLDSGLTMLSQLTGRPVLGVLPWQEGLWLDAEDSLSLDNRGDAPSSFGIKDFLRVAV